MQPAPRLASPRDRPPRPDPNGGPAGRWAIALLTSFALHGGVALWLTLSALALPAPPLGPIWLDLDNRLGAPAASPPAAPPQAPAPATKRADDAPGLAATATGRAPRRKAPPRPSPAPAAALPPAPHPTAALAEVAPGDAALLVLLRCDRVRDSPYAAGVRELLAAFYDYRTLLAGAPLDPLRDFDRLLIATPNPYRITETLLVARHALSLAAARTALEASVQANAGTLRWTEHEGSLQGELSAPPRLPGDRRLLTLLEGLIVFAAPELLEQLQRPTAATGPPAAGAAQGAATRPWVERLLEGVTPTARGSSEDGAAALLVQAINLPRLIRLPAGLPTPTAGRLAMAASANARVKVVLSFADAADAATALRAAALELTRLQSLLMLRVLGVSALIERLHLWRRGSELRASLVLEEPEVLQLLTWLRTILPQRAPPAHVADPPEPSGA
ncbi:MAG: hypothetical protein IPL40_03690 [Proteobacteria bacterium]|nr:hypothetical protein [Pseudomonadota bacterium]